MIGARGQGGKFRTYKGKAGVSGPGEESPPRRIHRKSLESVSLILGGKKLHRNSILGREPRRKDRFVGGRSPGQKGHTNSTKD